MKVTILTDNPNSWIVEFIPQLIERLSHQHNVNHVFSLEELEVGDILCALSCERIIKQNHRNLFQSIIVAHPSLLPQGKGWSPVAWQILEGRNRIPVSLIEAVDKVDSGDIYYQKYMEFSGYELNDEIKAEQFRVTSDLVFEYCNNYPVEGVKQSGEESFYRKFKQEDNRLDITKSIQEQFNLMRIADNNRYPSWFEIEGQRYEIKIYHK